MADVVCSPHPRGWSHVARAGGEGDRLLPAPAGMVPKPPSCAATWRTAPRTRGDGPGGRPTLSRLQVCSPHPRGWSPQHIQHLPAGRLLPAPAGMVPGTWPARSWGSAAPRTRGDGPGAGADNQFQLTCSPHPRGWSPRHSRGRTGAHLLPAPAGMVPTGLARSRRTRPAPRTRGDGPWWHPDDPSWPFCSPHPRGWSHDRHRLGRVLLLLPAPAGMVPRRSPGRARRSTAPRTRGDGPETNRSAYDAQICSPHPRGWSQRRALRPDEELLLPAPAGMVPKRSERQLGSTTAPRTRGDGPAPPNTSSPADGCSPHPRGWSRAAQLASEREGLLPAPAGMVPSTWTAGPPVSTCSPHPRGWSPVTLEAAVIEALLPSPAGMVPAFPSGVPGPPAAPRTRGDGPARHQAMRR